MVRASKFADLFKAKSLFRYWKKGFVLGILYGLVWFVINTIITTILGSMGIPVTTIMGAVQVGGIAVVVTVIIGLVLQGIITGFLVEYINNTNNKAIKWVKK